MYNKKFEGWYFKHQAEHHTVSFIVGGAYSGSFIQVVSENKSWQFDMPVLYTGDTLCCEGCVFSLNGVTIDLPQIKGYILYGPMQELNYDIMGPFAMLPMQCRHGVLSMRHSLTGFLVIEGEKICFDGGVGYIEKDSGISFPKKYLWVQCNEPKKDFSIMTSIADIPFGLFDFTGCICSVIHNGKQYRFATYNGVKIVKASKNNIRLFAAHRLLDIAIDSEDSPQLLKSPLDGEMIGTTKESVRIGARFRMWEDKKLVFDIKSNVASFENLNF